MPRRLLLLVAAGCAGAPARPTPPPVVTISVIGTNDLHGHVAPDKGRGGLAMLGGYVNNVRKARAQDHGGVLLLDGGDMFQGTLESNPNEGAAVVQGMNALGYVASAVGNHEFDFGPAGPLVVQRTPEDDARGALRARAAEAAYPFLDANVIEDATGKPLAGKGLMPSTMTEVAGVKIGIVGVITSETATSTLAANIVGLHFRPLAETIDEETRKLRAAGAELVVVVAHAGLCARVSDADDILDCDSGEILDAVRALKEPIDVVVAGHTHAGAVRREGRVAITEAFKYGRGFGRVDVVFDRARHQVVKSEIFPPHLMAPGEVYEGEPVVPDAKVEAAVAPFVTAAESKRRELLGVQVESTVAYSYGEESMLGNLVADIVRAARKGDVGVSNGGGLRRNLEPGDLTYGVVFETYPFDNRFAIVKITGADLRRMITNNLKSSKGFINISGARAVAVCRGEGLAVKLTHEDGREIKDDEKLTMITSDFLASGGMEGALVPLPAAGLRIEEGGSIREEIVEALRHHAGPLRGDDPSVYDPAHPRVSYPGKRPVSCPVK